MLAAFTVSITIKQQKISVRPIFPFKGMNSTESSFFLRGITHKKVFDGKKKHKTMNFHALRTSS